MLHQGVFFFVSAVLTAQCQLVAPAVVVHPPELTINTDTVEYVSVSAHHAKPFQRCAVWLVYLNNHRIVQPRTRTDVVHTTRFSASLRRSDAGNASGEGDQAGGQANAVLAGAMVLCAAGL